jgi:hypothetical protein
VKFKATNDGYYIRNIPGLSNNRKNELTQEEISDFKQNPWSHYLKPSWESMHFILNDPIFNVSSRIFLRPSPKSFGGDIYFLLPYEKHCKFIIFQFKYHQERSNGYGDFCWSQIQHEIHNVSRILPNSDGNNTIKNAFKNDDIHICLVFVIFGLAKQVASVIETHCHKTSENSLLLSSGNWTVDDDNNFMEALDSCQNPILSIPNNMEVLLLSKKGLECLLGHHNYSLLEEHKNDFKRNLLADKADRIFDLFQYMTVPFEENEDLGMYLIFRNDSLNQTNIFLIKLRREQQRREEQVMVCN